MESSQNSVNNLLPLTPAVFYILLALSNEDLHGYGIMKSIEDITNGDVMLKPGTLYQAIKRLLVSKIIDKSNKRVDKKINDERRRYYHLTGFGQRVLIEETKRLNSMVQLARKKSVFRTILLIS